MFQSSLPATSTHFFDRVTELSRLTQLVERLRAGTPAWLAVIGQRKIGKTSLILELTRRWPSQEVAFVVLDVFEEIPVSEEFFRRYGLRTLDAVLSSALGVSLESLAERPSEYRVALLQLNDFRRLPPQLQSEILELPERAADAQLVKLCLELPERLAQALGRWLVVAIDEFQELASMSGRKGEPNLLPLMRSAWQRHSRVAYIISGSARTMLLELVTAEHSPFFQHFELMELGAFSKEDAVQLLVQASPQDRPIERSLAVRVVDAIGSHPFYLQLFGEGLVRQPLPLDEQALKAALQELLFSRTGRLALYFEAEYRRLVGRSTFLASCLKALAEGPQRITDVAHSIQSPSGATVTYLERLGDAVVKDSTGCYRLLDPTFGLWLRWRQPGGSVIPMRLLGDEAEKSTVETLARMGFELIYQSRASRGAFDLLATRGAHQLAVQVKRTHLPLRFTLTEWNRMEADGQRFGWRWVIAAVSAEGQVVLLDPAHARKGKEIRLTADAAIENLLKWVDQVQVG